MHAEEDASLARGGKDPFIVVKAPSASKGGVAETSIKVKYFFVFDDITGILLRIIVSPYLSFSSNGYIRNINMT